MRDYPTDRRAFDVMVTRGNVVGETWCEWDVVAAHDVSCGGEVEETHTYSIGVEHRVMESLESSLSVGIGEFEAGLKSGIEREVVLRRQVDREFKVKFRASRCARDRRTLLQGVRRIRGVANIANRWGNSEPRSFDIAIRLPDTKLEVQSIEHEPKCRCGSALKRTEFVELKHEKFTVVTSAVPLRSGTYIAVFNQAIPLSLDECDGHAVRLPARDIPQHLLQLSGIESTAILKLVLAKKSSAWIEAGIKKALGSESEPTHERAFEPVLV